jgi:coenzyme F420-0:L-glutamate ligase/coenzyme F420-1:gamma-L-glutamate ligase
VPSDDPSVSVEVLPVEGLPEVRPGDDLAALLAVPVGTLEPRTGDILAVTQKVVSKAEGRVVPEGEGGRSAWVEREATRIVARRGDLTIAETAHGFVCANAGVDASNVEAGFLTLLPKDPDASAGRIRADLERLLGVGLGVVVTDTFGRPWRRGVVNVAIGCAGVPALLDLRGSADHHGRRLEATVVAVADEIAAASGLAMAKAARVPAALIRGLDLGGAAGTARELVRPPEEDLFRESPLQSILARRDAPGFGPGRVPREALEEAVRAACAAPFEGREAPWLFVVATSTTARRRLASAAAASGDVAGLEAVATAPVQVVAFAPAATAGEEPSGELLLASGMAVENLMLALHAHGLASRWLPAAGREGSIRAALGIEGGWLPTGVVVVGRTAAAAGSRPPRGLPRVMER